MIGNVTPTIMSNVPIYGLEGCVAGLNGGYLAASINRVNCK